MTTEYKCEPATIIFKTDWDTYSLLIITIQYNKTLFKHRKKTSVR